jgi:hypothetical protein
MELVSLGIGSIFETDFRGKEANRSDVILAMQM